MSNRKGSMVPGQEMVSVAAILFATLVVFFFTLMLGGSVTEETQTSQELLEEDVLTSNMLINLVEMEDSENKSYAYWIEQSLYDTEDYSYTETLISDWLTNSMGSNQYYNFYISYSGGSYLEMGGYGRFITVGELIQQSGTGDLRVNVVKVELPSREGKKAEVVMEIW